jgi:diguanylate cyclase (GGDEF)-like protein
MISPPTPEDEQRRIAALHALRILDTAPEERFDRYTRLARKLFNVPIALVSLIDTERQWFKSRQGLDASETSREISFCGHTILAHEPFIVNDAAHDVRFADNPLVAGDPHIRFYAGQPVQAPDGSNLGTFCLIDRTPRKFDAEELDLLQDLARMVEDEIASLALATTDSLTGVSNCRGFEMLSSKAISLCRRTEQPATLLFIDLDHFKAINDTRGHAAGDNILKETAGLLLDCFRESDIVARLGGDEFCVLLTNVEPERATVALTRLRQLVASRNSNGSGPHIEFSIGAARFDPEIHHDLAGLMNEADKHMYDEKRARHRSGVSPSVAEMGSARPA